MSMTWSCEALHVIVQLAWDCWRFGLDGVSPRSLKATLGNESLAARQSALDAIVK